jgi:ADP-heptose:LPS heptosyltransferase
MTQNTMRTLERWVGKPACAVFTCLHRARLFFSQAKEDSFQPPQKILLLKLIEQGASVLAFSAIEECVRRVGAKNVYFWVFEENKEIVRILNLIPDENLMVISHKSPFEFLKTLLGTLFRIRQAGIDTVIDMELFSRASAVLAFLSGARIRVGLHRFTSEAPYRGDLFTHKLAYNPFLHTSKAYLQLVLTAFESPRTVPMGKIPTADLQTLTPEYRPSNQDLKTVKRLLETELGPEFSTAPSVLFLLNPNASDLLPLRKWPLPNFIALARKILSSFDNAFVILTGAPSEREPVAQMAAEIGHPRCVSVAGKTSLHELLTLYSVSDILVTNDSGPGHFASMTDIDSIVLFGPETPRLFGPMGKSTHILWNEIACSPCVSAFNHRLSACNDSVCMKSISVQQVWEKIQAALEYRLEKLPFRDSDFESVVLPSSHLHDQSMVLQ